ncbi:amino acid permease, partial [Staphylococcus capitis]
LLAEYFIAVAFVASGFSANLRGLISPLGIKLPTSLSAPFGANGGIIDIIAAVVIILTALLLSRGMTEAARIENILVVLKIFAILLFVVVGLT